MITDVWRQPSAEVAAFLDDFDARGDGSDADVTTLFAPTFLALDPARALAITPAMLAAGLPARRRMFAEAGVGPIRRVDAREIRLDDRHALVSADWVAERAGGEPLRLSSMFLLRHEPDGWRVLVYLNHADVAALLAR
jgi:hypothetical protein